MTQQKQLTSMVKNEAVVVEDKCGVSFPEIITSSLIPSIDFNLEKCETSIRQLEAAPLEYFGSGGQKEKMSQRLELIHRAIKNYVISEVVSNETPLIPNDIFNIKRYYKVAFPKDERPKILEATLVEPDWSTVKQQEDKVQIRWCSGSYLVSISTRSSYDPTATLARLPYVGKRNSELHLKSALPCKLPVDIEQLHCQFLSRLYGSISKAYTSQVINRYLDHKGDRYSSSGYCLAFDINSNICWAPKLEHIYTEEKIIPPPGDPILYVTWQNCRFFIGAWETNNDDANLQTILKEFVI